MGRCTFQVKHSVEMLADLIREGKLKPRYAIKKTVTYHDPCHLGRHGKIFDAPRTILKAIPGLKLIEMNRMREYSFCCGGGGGVRTGKIDFAQATAERRIEEALDTGAEILTTVCPFCSQNFLDYLERSGSRLKFIDLIELLHQSVYGEEGTKKVEGAK
jgi:heterodisulfide reductase subunit D